MSCATDPSLDVVVVGGGPAGCATAIACAMQGMRVALLESREFPRPRPGESLHPGAAPILRQLGVEAELERIGATRYPGHVVAWGGAPEFQAFGSDERGAWLGFLVPGSVLDTVLRDRATALGVEVMQPCTARAPVLRGERVVGVESSAGLLAARFVVDAAGARHWLGRRTGAPIHRASRQLVAFYGWATSRAVGAGQCPWLEASPDGWSWAAPLGGGTYAWAALPFDGTRASPPAGLDGGPARGADVTWRLLPRTAGPGYFLTGDAAAVLDPLSSDGVLRGLMSGIQAAHMVHQVLRLGADEALAARAYREWYAALFRSRVAGLTRLYERLPWPSLGAAAPPSPGRALRDRL